MSALPVDKHQLDNTDLLQIEYLSELSISKREAIVVEPNDAIAITIHKFLEELGYEKTHICKELKECLEIFLDFASSEINAPIVIDTDTANNLENSIREIFEIQPNAKIVIITRREKTDLQIARLIDMGITSIAEKPLDFDNFKDSFGKMIGNYDNAKTVIEKKFDSILTSHSKLTYNKIKNILGGDNEYVELLIKNAIDVKKIIPNGEVLEAECNQCGSIDMIYTSQCHNCGGINFKQSYLIEHYSCGEVYPKTDNMICPKCNKSIGSAGTDYREFAEYYICASCNDKFPKPEIRFVCLKCGNMFNEKSVVWKKSRTYKVQK